MDLTHVLILLGAGACGGFVAGLVGVGGGIIFAPVLFFFFRAVDVPPSVVAPLTLGTSLLCTTIASSVSAWRHDRKSAVDWTVAVKVGLLSAVVLFLVVRFVTTQSWFTQRSFELVFAVVLLAMAIRMALPELNGASSHGKDGGSSTGSWPALAGIGSAAGGVAAAAGVGGGIILVPAYRHWLRFEMPSAVGTSSATIVLISGLGVLSYAFSPAESVAGTWSLGYVDVVRGLVLASPTIITAQLGAAVAHKLDRLLLQRIFALFAAVVAVRMLIG